MDEGLVLEQSIVNVLNDKKAQDIVVLSVKGICSFADYFVIATGTSSTHINGLSDHIEKELSKDHIYLKHKEGKPISGWVLLDYKDVIVHIFSADTRAYYALEHIWNDALQINL